MGLAPALWAIDRSRSWKGAFGLGLVAGLAFFYAATYWVSHAMTAFGGLSSGLALFALSLLVLYMAFHWGLALAASFAIRRRLGWPLWTHLPFVWAAAELLRTHLFTGFPWANLGYAQARHPVVSQLASLFGIYAVAALVLLVNCAVQAAAGAALGRRALPWRALAAAAAALVATLAYGEAHLGAVRRRMSSAPRLKVGLVQGNIDQSVKNEAARHARFILGRFVPLTAEADRAGADLVAWPEATYPFAVPPSIGSFADPRSGLEPLSRAHLLLGASTVAWRAGPSGRRAPEVTNSLFLLRPDLSVAQHYVKHHLVPFGEYVPLGRYLKFIRQVVPDLAPASAGSELETMRFPLGSANPALNPGPGPNPGAGAAGSSGDETSLAPMICFDAIFPEVNLEFARQDPELLVNPTNDAWYGYSSGPYQFLAMVRLRAIEAGKAVARPAYSGVTAVILPTGEVAPGAIDLGPVDPERAPDRNEPPRLLLAEVPRLRGGTLYTSIGDLFAWACAAFAILSLGLALRRRPA